MARVVRFPVPGRPDLDLEIREGDVVRIVGPNGAGKTSLLRSLAGLDAPIKPRHVSKQPAGMAMQDARDTLVGLTIAGEFRLRGLPVPAGLPNGNRDVATLSSGESRKVALAVASNAPLLLLDEPSEGLDPLSVHELRRMIESARTGGAVVIADHGGVFADVATRTVQLGHEFPVRAEPFTPGNGPRQDVNGRLLRPGLHAIVGPIGSGKTTALRSIWAEAPHASMLPAPGRDVLHGETVGDFLQGCDANVQRLLVPTALLKRHPLHLSGGEMQRVALAGVLGAGTDLVLLDEPETHLDQAGRTALNAVLRHRIAGGACIVVATHDGQLVRWSQTAVPP